MIYHFYSRQVPQADRWLAAVVGNPAPEGNGDIRAYR